MSYVKTNNHLSNMESQTPEVATVASSQVISSISSGNDNYPSAPPVHAEQISSTDSGYFGYLTQFYGLLSMAKSYVPVPSLQLSQYKTVLGDNTETYLKVFGVLVLLLVMCFGYVTFQLLSFLHFVNLTILSLRFFNSVKVPAPENTVQMQELLERWVGYAMLILTSDVLDFLFGSRGVGFFSFLALLIKLVLHYNLLVDSTMSKKLHTYGTKMYALNKPAIDKFQKGLEQCQAYVKDNMSLSKLSLLKQYIPGFATSEHSKTS